MYYEIHINILINFFCCLQHPLVTVAEPKVHEIEVPTITYKHVVEKVPIQPACQNHLGFAVPC